MAKKVLLAGDEEDILMLVSATLGGDERYDLILARDGEEALNSARQDMPDLIFLDVMMPKMDGFEVCGKLKSDPTTSGIKIVMLTAMAQEMDKEKADAAGADYYFTKPFSPTALMNKVEELLT